MSFDSWLESQGITDGEYDAMDEQEQAALHFDYGWDCNEDPAPDL